MISITWTMISSLVTITSRSTMDLDHLHPWPAFTLAARLPTIPTPRSPRPQIANINNNDSNKRMLAPDTSRQCPILLACRRTKEQCLLHLDLFLLLQPRPSRAASNMDNHRPPLSRNHNTPNINNNTTKEGNSAERSMPAIKAPLTFCQVSPKGERRCICMRRRMSTPSTMHQR